MSNKQDRQGARTASDLERKYNFGKSFAELMGIALDARESVDSLASSVGVVDEKVTTLTRDAESIAMTAAAKYADEQGLATTEEVSAALELSADALKLDFVKKEYVEGVEGKVDGVLEDMEKHFEFTENGLIIKAGENDVRLLLDNGIISFYAGNIDEDDPAKNRLGRWDGTNFYTGNIYVDVEERAQFGDFAFVPRSNGSLDFLKVGG